MFMVKKALLIISLVIFVWGIWIFLADRPKVYFKAGYDACHKNYSEIQPTKESISGQIDCYYFADKSAKELERNALIAVIIGGLSSLIFGVLVIKNNKA